jgi:tripartite-type tricarboxylate transporter receptor subunit TctC
MMLARLVGLGLAAVLLAGMGAARAADPYPVRPVHWIIPFPPGGATDVVARIMGQWLSEWLGQQVVIENRGGAGGNIATQSVINSPPDGYTRLFVPTASAINATLYEALPYNFIRDVAPVGGLLAMTAETLRLQVAGGQSRSRVRGRIRTRCAERIVTSPA